jgi:predicted nuclease with RNAse H fold
VNFLGFDPGGQRAFGWALIRSDEDATTARFVACGVVSSATAALDEAAAHLEEEPQAVGIDAPLFWGSRGDRLADALIRKQVRAMGGHSAVVAHVNSLRGACLAQGAIAAKEAAQRWPHALITETHPKALKRIDPAAREFLAAEGARAMSDHEKDALLGAFAAWSAFVKRPGWRDLLPDEFEPHFPLVERVSYWFPLPTERVQRVGTRHKPEAS